ncbi:phage protein Gp36 family protein [uncultured Helicobacter sp.]|uniref:phage protein Gp36 family protein n=1 Tax=uncultured Helicobacter sp. TaxID=175537 RepID=UPI002604BC53|nr:phage protein Gp36 family protein [uncultured Helicobacter sp.]
MENVENEKIQELQERSDISKNSQEEQEGKITETESTESGDTNAKTEVAKDCTNLYPNDDSSTNDSSFVSHRLSTNPSYTQEEATAIAVLKESRLAKNAAIQRLRRAYAETIADTQPNEVVLNELAAQMDLMKLEIDEIDASLKAIEKGAFNKNDSFKPVSSVLTPPKKPLITEAELINELGANEIKALSDIHGEGIWNRSVIDDSISDATALIASFFKIPANPTYLVRDICVKLAIVELKRRNAYPKEELEDIRNECLEWLNKMAQGKIPTSLEEESSEIRNQTRTFIHKNKPMKLKRMYD